MIKTYLLSFFSILLLCPAFGQSESKESPTKTRDSIIIDFDGGYLVYSKKGVQKLWDTDEVKVYRQVVAFYGQHDGDGLMPLIEDYYKTHDSTWVVPLLYKSTFLIDGAVALYGENKIEEGNKLIFEALAICQGIEDECLDKEKEVRMIAHVYSLCSPPAYESLLSKLTPDNKQKVEAYIQERISAIKAAQEKH